MKLYAEHTKMHHFHVKKNQKIFMGTSPDLTPVGKRRLARDPAAFLNHFKHCNTLNIFGTINWVGSASETDASLLVGRVEVGHLKRGLGRFDKKYGPISMDPCLSLF